MNPFLLTPTERLADWKVLRSSIASLEDDVALDTVTKYWAQAPLMRLAYDYEEMPKWPGPWAMVHQGDWCRDSVACGMEFTLRLGGWAPERMRLILVKDFDISEQMIVLEIDRTIFLNYDVGKVTPLPNTRWASIAAWEFTGRGYHPIKC